MGLVNIHTHGLRGGEEGFFRTILKTCLGIVYIPGAYSLMGVCPMWIVIENNTRAMLPINRN